MYKRQDPDPFESLYRDRPLSALVSADAPVAVSLRRLRVRKPCVLAVSYTHLAVYKRQLVDHPARGGPRRRHLWRDRHRNL